MSKTYNKSTMHSAITGELLKKLLPASPKIKNYICFDDSFKMFGVRVTSSGFMSYVVKLPNAKGNYVTKSLGSVNNIKPAKARSDAQEMFRQAKATLGFNVQEDTEYTFHQLANKYLNGHAKAKKKTKSFDEDARRLKADSMLIRVLGPKKLQNIKRGDILAIHEAKSKTPYEANRTLSLLSKMFNYAIIDTQIVTMENPCKGIAKYKEQGKQNIADKETQRILLDILNSSNEIAAYVCKLRFFTGARVTEALHAKKSEFDLKKGTWQIPHERMKSNKVEVKHLPVSCVEMLENYIEQVPGDYLFPGNDGKPMKSTKTFFNNLKKKASLILAIRKRLIEKHGEQKGIDKFNNVYKKHQLWSKNSGGSKYSKGIAWIYKELFGTLPKAEEQNILKDLRQYDIRHMYATELAIQGVPIHVVKEMMGHSTVKVTEKYLHNMKGEKEKAAEIASKAFDIGNI